MHGHCIGNIYILKYKNDCNMNKIVLLLSLCPVFAMQSYGTKPQLRISGGAPDTTAYASTVIVGVTDPFAVATINGNSTKVYKTGSFGAKVDLVPGVNNINVAVYYGNDTTYKTVSIYRKPATSVLKKEEPQFRLYDTPGVIETKEGAFLQYGDGDDRLGGSKMGFIDSGIHLVVDGERGKLYRVRLAVDRVAYIPKSYAQTVNESLPEVVNTGRWTVTNEGKSDQITIALPRRLAWHAGTSLNPNEISVDIFGAFDNSNWIVQRSLDLGIIDYVDFHQIASDVYRVVIRLKGESIWGYNIGYDNTSSNLRIQVRHKPKSLKLGDLTIGLDAGHGGGNSGAVSPSGINEKDINLDIVQRLKVLLEKKGAKVVLTRSDDSNLSMAERKRIWSEANVDLSISVHNNAGGSALSSPGTSVYYKHVFCRPFAEIMCRSMLETSLPLYGLVGNFNFSLVGPTICPTCLVEGAFMSSLEEEEKLSDPEFRQLMAQKIYEGLCNYLKSVR